MNKPKSVDDFIAREGPFDPPLTPEERDHVQLWIDGSGCLFLRNTFTVDPADARIAELQSKLEAQRKDFASTLQAIIEAAQPGFSTDYPSVTTIAEAALASMKEPPK